MEELNCQREKIIYKLEEAKKQSDFGQEVYRKAKETISELEFTIDNIKNVNGLDEIPILIEKAGTTFHTKELSMGEKGTFLDEEMTTAVKLSFKALEQVSTDICKKALLEKAFIINEQIQYWHSVSSSKTKSFFVLLSNHPFRFYRLFNYRYIQFSAKISELEEAKKQLTIVLGSILMQETKKDLEKVTSFQKVSDDIENQYNQVNNLVKESDIVLQRNKKPSWLQRNWIFLTATTVGLYFGLKGYLGIDKMWLHQFLQDIKQASMNFLTEWIYYPLYDIWKTIRYNQDRLAVTSAKSLESDLNSLERMVTDFAKDNYGISGETALTQISKDVREGDISLVMEEYEKNLKSPLKSLVLGDLMRVILIQVQKSKVDLAIAMKALDKLLKSNELNFEIFAVIPAVAILVFSVRVLKNYLESKNGRFDSESELLFKETLRSVERKIILLMNQEEFDLQTLGEIYIELHTLSLIASKKIKNKRDTKILLEDLEDLKGGNLLPNQKYLVIQRIYKTCAFLN